LGFTRNVLQVLEHICKQI